MQNPEDRYFLIRLSDFEAYEKNSDPYITPKLRQNLLRMEAPEPLAEVGDLGETGRLMFNRLPPYHPDQGRGTPSIRAVDLLSGDGLAAWTEMNDVMRRIGPGCPRIIEAIYFLLNKVGEQSRRLKVIEANPTRSELMKVKNQLTPPAEWEATYFGSDGYAEFYTVNNRDCSIGIELRVWEREKRVQHHLIIRHLSKLDRPSDEFMLKLANELLPGDWKVDNEHAKLADTSHAWLYIQE